MRAHIPWAAALMAATFIAAPSGASAQEADGANECRLHSPLQPTRLLRRAALALLGRVPTLDEYNQVKDLEVDGPEFTAVIDGWFESDAYREQMRRYHMQLLWANPAGVSLRDGNFLLTRLSDGDGGFLWRLPSVGVRRTYRGGTGLHDCQNVQQTTLEPGYQFGATPYCEPKGSDNIGEFCQEGYVEVNPFWAPNTTLKVCAFDAQTTETYTSTNGAYAGEFTCNDWQARFVDTSPDPGSQRTNVCGCGPNLDYCMAAGGGVNLDTIVTDSMREQLLRLVDDYTQGQAPYSELLTTKRAYVNGPLTHYFKHHAPMGSTGRTHNVVYDDVPLQDSPWTDDGWYQVERTHLHSGILTLPAYLLRFQTNRGRANRFRIAFMGQYFVPSETAAPGCNEDTDDVTEKCYCAGCHQNLEPMSMFFGSFAEAGSASLFNLQKTYVDEPGGSTQGDYYECAKQWPPYGFAWCNRFYNREMIDDPANPGTEISSRSVNPLEFGAAHPEFEVNYDQGPAGLLGGHALKKLSGKEYSFFAWATARNLFKYMIGRELIVDPLSADNEQKLLDELALSFETSDHNFQQLVKTIVELPTFRRMP